MAAPVDVVGFGEGRSPVYFPVVPGLVDDGKTFPFAPCELHSAAVNGRFGARRKHGCFGDGNAGVEGKVLTFFLLVSVDCERKIGINARDGFGHVVVNVGL